jgi:hypothetical protein
MDDGLRPGVCHSLADAGAVEAVNDGGHRAEPAQLFRLRGISRGRGDLMTAVDQLP